MTDRQRAALLRSALADFRKTREGFVTHPNGPNWRAGMDKADRLLKDLALVVPQLGPLCKDGLSTMLMVPTHRTTGVDWTPKGDGRGVYVAFDDGFGDGGRPMLAVDGLKVTRGSSAQGGDAFYCTLACGIWGWYGHLDVAPPVGTTFRKGQIVGRIKHGPGQPPGGPHAHLGLDVSPLGMLPLLYGGQRKRTDQPVPYSFGSPTIGAQLAKGMA